ncbi:hypothetical protein PAUR_a1386 [Pseudoalteromonas aurantia 208]|uniref:Uncharacterized protein n=1 Tax=Pseudoalteromonas aurantia 208 TaxID=1314867 RepID=A0ABR9EAB2_9GAMM|nr:hypothetical protein [Pseudoalteromonas aurantia 208]
MHANKSYCFAFRKNNYQHLVADILYTIYQAWIITSPFIG